jgi:hypothetical protein
MEKESIITVYKVSRETTIITDKEDVNILFNLIKGKHFHPLKEHSLLIIVSNLKPMTTDRLPYESQIAKVLYILNLYKKAHCNVKIITHHPEHLDVKIIYLINSTADFSLN